MDEHWIDAGGDAQPYGPNTRVVRVLLAQLGSLRPDVARLYLRTRLTQHGAFEGGPRLVSSVSRQTRILNDLRLESHRIGRASQRHAAYDAAWRAARSVVMPPGLGWPEVVAELAELLAMVDRVPEHDIEWFLAPWSETVGDPLAAARPTPVPPGG
jgi:hypothetical protein